MYSLYLIIAIFLPTTFALHILLQYYYLIKMNVDYKIAMTWALNVMIGCKNYNYRGFLIHALEENNF